VVALHDLAPGSRLRLDDVAVQPRPDQGLPDDAVADPASLLGRTVVFPVHAGEVTTARAVVSDTLLSAFGPDVRATPVHLADDTSSLLLRAGDVVDVLSASAAHIGDTPGTARAVVVASRVRVLVAPSVATTTGGPLSTGGTPSSQVLVLATTADEALALAAAAVSGHLSVTVRTP
jgi:Flp pilus assembly protein CpaB